MEIFLREVEKVGSMEVLDVLMKQLGKKVMIKASVSLSVVGTEEEADFREEPLECEYNSESQYTFEEFLDGGALDRLLRWCWQNHNRQFKEAYQTVKRFQDKGYSI